MPAIKRLSCSSTKLISITKTDNSEIEILKKDISSNVASLINKEEMKTELKTMIDKDIILKNDNIDIHVISTNPLRVGVAVVDKGIEFNFETFRLSIQEAYESLKKYKLPPVI